jgi:hypothetical protein
MMVAPREECFQRLELGRTAKNIPDFSERDIAPAPIFRAPHLQVKPAGCIHVSSAAETWLRESVRMET